MTASSTTTSSRKKTLLLAAGVILALALIAAAVVATQPDLLARVRGSLPGAVVKDKYYVIRPRHVGDVNEMSLAEVPWIIPDGGHYVNLWQWDENAASDRKWLITETVRWTTRGNWVFHKIRINGRYLTVRNDSKEEGADVITYPGDSGSNDVWDIELVDRATNGVEWYQIRSYSSGLCLAVKDAATTNGSALVQSKCDQYEYNRVWRFIERW